MYQVTTQFFAELYDISLRLIEDAPISIEPSTIDHIANILTPTMPLNNNQMFSNPSNSLSREKLIQNKKSEVSAGLNTVGMLLDRLSILAIKSWNLSHRARDEVRCKALRQGEISEILAALVHAQPGLSSMNTKITVHKVDVKSVDFASAYNNLLITNILLWEAQEMLYNRDISVLPVEELRQYIIFFSNKNLQRNILMEESEHFFWEAIQNYSGKSQ